MAKPIQYKIEEGTQNRVEHSRRGDNLILQLFPRRLILAKEAAMEDSSGPTAKIIMAIDTYNPKHIKTTIRIPQETLEIDYYTIEFKDFYHLPTDTEYMRNKITKALRDLVL